MSSLQRCLVLFLFLLLFLFLFFSLFDSVLSWLVLALDPKLKGGLNWTGLGPAQLPDTTDALFQAYPRLILAQSPVLCFFISLIRMHN